MKKKRIRRSEIENPGLENKGEKMSLLVVRIKIVLLKAVKSIVGKIKDYFDKKLNEALNEERDKLLKK